MPHTLEPTLTCVDVCLKHFTHCGAQPQVGVPDDALSQHHPPCAACLRHGDDSLGLTHRPECLSGIRAVARLRLHVNGGHNSMTTPCVGQVVVCEICPARAVVEVVVRVDDAQFRVNDRFLPQG